MTILALAVVVLGFMVFLWGMHALLQRSRPGFPWQMLAGRGLIVLGMATFVYLAFDFVRGIFGG